MTRSNGASTTDGLRFSDVTIHAGGFSLSKVDFSIPSGAYAILMGATGCGKTTILEATCGLREIDSGRIEIGGRSIESLAPARRRIGYVPQDGALFPTMTAIRQIALPLLLRGIARENAHRRAEELCELVDIGHLVERRPDGFSGGERQRVAIARAIACEPELLLMDEPIGALDEVMRERVVRALRAVHEHTGVTTLHVTHDPRDVTELSTMLYRLENGSVSSC
jgi:ABC-type sugar transport system ATPase subunit